VKECIFSVKRGQRLFIACIVAIEKEENQGGVEKKREITHTHITLRISSI